MGFMPTRSTKELTLTFPIGFLSMSTFSTPLRRVGRVNELDRNAVLMCLVDDTGLQLVKAPVAAFCPVFTPNPGPQGNALQIFQGNPSFRAFSVQNQLLGKAVINIGLKRA